MAERYSWPADEAAIHSMLDAVDPTGLSYDEWLHVGMGLKDCGAPFETWDEWSRRDPSRYKGDGGMLRKWDGFDNGGGVSVGTLARMARERGWEPQGAPHGDGGAPPQGKARKAEPEPPDLGRLPEADVPEPPDLNPPRQLARYLDAMFGPGELVNVVTAWAYGSNGKPRPSGNGLFVSAAALWACAGEPSTRSVSDALSMASGSNVAADPTAGAWIRVNPMDGAGVADANVTAYRHALVECDELPRDEQLKRLVALNLPCAAIVDSGGKSVHAIIKVDAGSEAEHKERVRFLYAVCEANGLPLDPANKNPGRLSRLPGAARGEGVQRLVAVNCGAESWAAWRSWVEGRARLARSGLPEMRPLGREVWENLPPRAPAIIDGVLRRGHKMMLAGPSKAGKTFSLMELCCDVAEGREWLGFEVLERGPAVYINLELDARSCHKRIRAIYDAKGWPTEHIDDVIPWDLRGRAVTMERLADAVIEQAAPYGPALVVVDPIYKVMQGDENSAGDVARMLAHFDRMAESLGCTVAFAHHYAKGAAGAKDAMDRASGSGSFARDPDALITLSPLRLDDGAECEAGGRPAFRVEGTLREFRPFEPFDVWFEVPIHVRDAAEVLRDCPIVGSSKDNSRKANDARGKKLEPEHDRITALLDSTVAECWEDGTPPTVAELYRRLAGTEYREGMKVKHETLRNWSRAGWCPYRLVNGVMMKDADATEGGAA